MNKQTIPDNLRRMQIRLRSWEYWPMWIVYASVSFYYVYMSVKARSLLFFSASNPSIEFGGMCFERKSRIYEIIPKENCPSTFLVYPDYSRERIMEELSNHRISFPLIAKPDIGGKGWGVKKIKNIDELSAYQKVCQVEFLVQEWIPFPLELSIFYCRYPSWSKGVITSVTSKYLLTVTGNGKDDIEQLIRKDDRAFLQLENLRKENNINLHHIPAAGESVTLVPYGNHARGALFRDCHDLIDEEMTNAVDALSKKIDGFYFGRFDLLTTSLEDLRAGKNIAVVELNGCGAEPIHIYDPSCGFIKGQKTIWQHFKMMFDIAMENKKNGVAFIKPSDYINGWKLEKAYKKKAPAEKLLMSNQ